MEFGDLFQENINRKRLKETDQVVFIGMQDVNENAIIKTFTKLNYSQVKSGFTYFEKNDVLVAKITPCFENGKGGFANNIPTDVGFGSTEFHILRAKEHVDPRYVYYQTKRPRFRNELEGEMVGSAGHRRVPLASIRKFELETDHSKEEQTAIANALSDVDALITSLEKLITKKRAIKTAAMQQLLTGKKRLPPFDKNHIGYKQTELGEIPEDWEVSELSKFVGALDAGISVNSVENKAAFGHGKAILKTSCIADGYFYPDKAKGIIPKDVGRARLNPKKGNIIISRMNTPDLVGEIGYIDNDYDDLFLPDRLWQTKYISGVKVCGRWLAFMLNYPDVANQIKESATGTSNSMKNISKGSLLSTLLLSPPFEEQEAIAEVISSMDKELEKLEQRLNKTQQLKQGMMQELLTGKTRLV